VQLKYFRASLIFTAICFGLATWLGWSQSGTVSGVLSVLWIVAVLSILEISLSFDNSVVDATILRDMDEVWRKRFLTWGIFIGVFGMRIIFPLVIVAVAAKLGPIDALTLAVNDPKQYETIISGAHVSISGFGGAFLGMVGLKFFFDADKEVHWIGVLERQLMRMGNIQAIEIGLIMILVYAISTMLPTDEALTYIVSALFGVITFIGVGAISTLLNAPHDATGAVARSGLASFLYLEMIDASFSLDGVIGAFALSNNIFVIALGLGIGAMFVRSMTIMFVEKGTLTEFRYLEHGAFWAILALAAIMLVSVKFYIPETVTGLIGAILIGISFWWSVRYNRKAPVSSSPASP
jgi:uncharacterized protein